MAGFVETRFLLLQIVRRFVGRCVVVPDFDWHLIFLEVVKRPGWQSCCHGDPGWAVA